MDEHERRVFADSAMHTGDVYDGDGHTFLLGNAWNGLHVHVLHLCMRHHDYVLANERRATYKV